MSKRKLFSFIYGEATHVAPRAKVIPANTVSTLKSALEIQEEAKNHAERYRKEVVAEIEQLKEQAQREGFEEGFRQWTLQVAKLEEEIAAVRKEMEKLILPVALKAAKKIVNRELEVAPEAIADIVAGTLKAVSQHKQVTIYVNRKDLDILESKRAKLKELFESLEVLSIRERSNVEPGGCIIETEAGIINAQLENRWRILEQAFSTLMKSK